MRIAVLIFSTRFLNFRFPARHCPQQPIPLTPTLHKIWVQNSIDWVNKGRLIIFKDESVLHIRWGLENGQSFLDGLIQTERSAFGPNIYATLGLTLSGVLWRAALHAITGDASPGNRVEYLPPHSIYDTADRTTSTDIEIPAYLLQIVASKSPQQIHRNTPRFI